MAIIKCPECGNPVSDKAPFCPKCGVEIAGKIKPVATPPPPIPPTEKTDNPQSSNEENKKNGTFTDAPKAHIDSIQAHLFMLQQGDKDWTNALVSNSKSLLEAYIANHPDSPHKAEAEHKIDSIDWANVSTTNTLDAYNTYLQDHPNGEHVDEAKDGIKSLNAKTIQPEEKQMLSSLFRHFFQSINSRDEIALTNTCETLMTSFLGKTDATKNDVATFLDKIWKDDMTNMNWHINNDYAIDKKEVGEGEYEYTVKFSAVQTKEFEDTSKNGKSLFRINAKVSPDDKISSFNMVKIVE